MKIHKASMDSLTLGLTIGVTIILLLSGFIPVFTSEFHLSNVLSPGPLYVMPFAMIIIPVLTFGFSPKGYVIEDDVFTILRPFKTKNYPLSDIQSVTEVEKKNLKGSIRTFGVGGLFGYFGRFRNSTYGNMVWYATRRDRFVVIKCSNGKTIVITPDDPAAFVLAYQTTVGK
jgi:hypothetical protein